MRIDVNTFLGRYPYRRVEGGSPAALLMAMARNEIDQAWISNLAAVFWRDPTEGNATLYGVAEHHPAFRPVPAVHPGLANWPEVLAEAVDRGAPAVRVDPTFYGLEATGAGMRAVVGGAGAAGLPMIIAARLEDGRQRHPNDGASELTAAALRGIIRMDDRTRLIVTHADRELIEQVHFGATPAESARILWEICWIWGPPTDDLAHLITAVGGDRFCFGTGMPLRIPESSVAKLELLECSEAERAAIESENAIRFALNQA